MTIRSSSAIVDTVNFTMPITQKQVDAWLDSLGACVSIKIPVAGGFRAERFQDILYFENRERKACVKTSSDFFKSSLSMKEAADLTAHEPFAYPLMFSTHPHIPIIPVCIKGKAYNMGIDCGAEGNLLDLRHLEPLRDADALLSEQEDTLTDIARADAKITSASLGPVSIYDALRFDAMCFVFSVISHLQTQGDIWLDGIIGYELLSRAKTLLRYAKKEILFAGYSY